jgi:hypothetical protein
MCDVVWKLGDFDHTRRSGNTKEEIGADTLFSALSFEPKRGAEAFRRDTPGAIIRFFDPGHFALETYRRLGQ